MPQTLWWALALSYLEVVTGRGGVDISVLQPPGNTTFTEPIEVKINLRVGEGNDATRLRADPGAYELCYGVQGGVEEVACFGIGDPIITSLPRIEDAHLDPTVVASDSDFTVQTIVVWLRRHNGEEEVDAVAVPFKAHTSHLIAARRRQEEEENDEEDKLFRESGADNDQAEAISNFTRETSANFSEGYTIIPSLIHRERAMNIAGFVYAFVLLRLYHFSFYT